MNRPNHPAARKPPPCGRRPWRPPQSWASRLQATTTSQRVVLAALSLSAAIAAYQLATALPAGEWRQVLGAAAFILLCVPLALLTANHHPRD